MIAEKNIVKALNGLTYNRSEIIKECESMATRCESIATRGTWIRHDALSQIYAHEVIE